ncbi:MAG: chorismate--pyruvate lyase [Lachnospiraceae bacterium]|nr:chorismate--pyruvate lyase [Lachnospiraceae bacterium]
MFSCTYVVERIDGDYAYLRDIDEPDKEPVFVARALLPLEIMEGTKLRYEMLQYEIVY